jgi:hypothetical protein
MLFSMTQKDQQKSERKTIDDLVRERDILNKNLVKASNVTSGVGIAT